MRRRRKIALRACAVAPHRLVFSRWAALRWSLYPCHAQSNSPIYTYLHSVGLVTVLHPTLRNFVAITCICLVHNFYNSFIDFVMSSNTVSHTDNTSTVLGVDLSGDAGTIETSTMNASNAALPPTTKHVLTPAGPIKAIAPTPRTPLMSSLNGINGIPWAHC
jgi:hypothetical protein